MKFLIASTKESEEPLWTSSKRQSVWDAHVTGPTGFADVDVLMIQVAHLTDAGGAVHPHIPDLAGGQTDLGQLAILGHELGSGTGRADPKSVV